jgi:hypothetical protein
MDESKINTLYEDQNTPNTCSQFWTHRIDVKYQIHTQKLFVQRYPHMWKLFEPIQWWSIHVGLVRENKLSWLHIQMAGKVIILLGLNH